MFRFVFWPIDVTRAGLRKRVVTDCPVVRYLIVDVVGCVTTVVPTCITLLIDPSFLADDTMMMDTMPVLSANHKSSPFSAKKPEMRQRGRRGSGTRFTHAASNFNVRSKTGRVG